MLLFEWSLEYITIHLQDLTIKAQNNTKGISSLCIITRKYSLNVYPNQMKRIGRAEMPLNDLLQIPVEKSMTHAVECDYCGKIGYMI